jgi:hypothetical protein
VVVTLIDIVDSNQTVVFPMERATLRTATNFADVLVVVPQVVTTDTAASITLDKDAAAPSLIAPAVPGLVNSGFVTEGVKLVMALSIRGIGRSLHVNGAMTEDKLGGGWGAGYSRRRSKVEGVVVSLQGIDSVVAPLHKIRGRAHG